MTQTDENQNIDELKRTTERLKELLLEITGREVSIMGEGEFLVIEDEWLSEPLIEEEWKKVVKALIDAGIIDKYDYDFYEVVSKVVYYDILTGEKLSEEVVDWEIPLSYIRIQIHKDRVGDVVKLLESMTVKAKQ